MLDIEIEEVFCSAVTLLVGCGALLLAGFPGSAVVGAAAIAVLIWLGIHWLKVRLDNKIRYGRWFF